MVSTRIINQSKCKRLFDKIKVQYNIPMNVDLSSKNEKLCVCLCSCEIRPQKKKVTSRKSCLHSELDGNATFGAFPWLESDAARPIHATCEHASNPSSINGARMPAHSRLRRQVCWTELFTPESPLCRGLCVITHRWRAPETHYAHNVWFDRSLTRWPM